MSSASTPPAAKKTSAVAMYKIPIRLWSTVVSQLATLPCFQSTTGTVSALTATRRRSLVDALLEVGEQRLQLLVRPAGTDGRHAPATLGHDLVEPGRLRDDRVRRDRRTVVALRLHPMACRADALELRTPELRRRGRADVLVVVRLGRRDHPRAHRFVVEPAELGALADVRLGGVGLEPRVVRPAGNRVGLAAELRYPPAVVHVGRDDRQVDDLPHRHVQVADRARTVRIVELPVELVAFDGDVQPIARARRRHVGDPRQLPEDDDADHGEDDRRGHGPDHLEPRLSLRLRAYGATRAAASYVIPDQEDEGRIRDPADDQR